MSRGYREKALAVRGWLDAMLGDAIEECRGGQASFYYYLTLDGIRTEERLARSSAAWRGPRVSEEVDGPAEGKLPRVAYIPGEFCVHPKGAMVEQGTRQLRLSYGYEELGHLEEAIGYMAEAVRYTKTRRTGESR